MRRTSQKQQITLLNHHLCHPEQEFDTAIKYFLFLSFLIISSLFAGSVVISQTIFPVTAFEHHLKILGSDSLEGRGTGTRGEKKAAQYITGHLKKQSLIPIGDDHTFMQHIPMHGSLPLKESRLILSNGEQKRELVLGKDYLLFKTGPETFVPNPVPLVFVGYGIIAPEFDYNDYQLIDVRDKIVVYLSGEPPSSDSAYFFGSRPTIYSFPESKERIAISRGARGSILIPNIDDPAYTDWNDKTREFSFEDVRLAYSASAQFSLIVRPDIAARFFDNAPFSLQQIYFMHKTNAMQSFSLESEISFLGSFKKRDFLGTNVMGKLEGQDPKLKDSYIVLTAHFDHLGIGPPVNGDSIYNGVFDNAAGVAALLELADAFVRQKTFLKRSLIFLFVTGEEKGLLGSTYYINNPAVPLYRTIANINIDGIAMFDTFNDIVGIGGEFSSLDIFLQQAANRLGLHVSPIPEIFYNSEAFLSSDQIAFARAGIPSMITMEGLNYRHHTQAEGIRWFLNWGKTRYHSPFDDLHQEMNLQAAAEHFQVLFELIRLLANSEEVPKWKPGAPFINARLQSIAEKR